MKRQHKKDVPAEESQGDLMARPESAVAVIDMEVDAGSGLDEATSEDIAIPFLTILQKGSPQVDPSDGAHVDGATPGAVFNTVTGELFEGAVAEGIDVIPCYFRREVIEWRLREKGGGLVAVHPKDTPLLGECTRDNKNRDVRQDGQTHLVVTANHYVLLPDGQTAVISMSSTQLKKSRKWNTMMSTLRVQGRNGAFNPPTFSHLYRLRTVPEKNDKGSWMGWSITQGKMLEDAALYKQAKAFAELVRSGAVRPTDQPPEMPEAEANAA